MIGAVLYPTQDLGFTDRLIQNPYRISSQEGNGQ